MEGALASVVGGLTPAPVVAVPTRRLRRGARRRHRAARHARVVRGRRHRGRHRQRLRRGVRRAAVVEVTVVAWFHCFSGIAGDMALGALVDAGADLDEVRTLCERLPVAAGRSRPSPSCAAASPARRSTCTPRRQPSCAPRPHRGAGRGGPPARAGAAPRPGHVRGAGRGRGPAPPPPPEQVHFHEVGGTRRHHRHRRHLRRARGARRRRGPRVSRSPTASAWCGPRTACCRTRRPRSSSCCAARPPTARRARRADHADRRRAAGRDRRPGGGRCRRWRCAQRLRGREAASSTDGRT